MGTLKNSQISIISKVFETEEDYINSEEFAKVYKGYENNIPSKLKARRGSKFLKGFVINVDPKTNYGQPFKLYRWYEINSSDISNGMRFIMEESVISSLDSYPFVLVIIDKEFKYFVKSYDFTFSKTNENRKYLAEKKVTVC